MSTRRTMGVLGAVSKLVALVAVAVGTIGKVKPELFLKLCDHGFKSAERGG